MKVIHSRSVIGCILPSIALAVVVLPFANASAQPMGPSTVAVSPVVEQSLPATLRLVGTVRPERTATIASELEGMIATVAMDEGAFVQRGSVLVELDHASARLRLDEARARLAALQAELDELLNGTRREELERWRAAVDEAEAIMQKWDYERRRVEDLFQRDQSNPKEHHDASMEHQAAVRRHAQLKAQLEQAMNGARPETVARARATLAAQQSVVDRLDRELKLTIVRAPFDGFVTRKRTEIGEWIEPGGAVCEMVAVETVRVRVDVPAAAFAYCAVGGATSVEFESTAKSLASTIARVVPQADASARTFPIEIDLNNADHKILPGMFAWAHVPAGAPGKRLLVPKDAIVQRGQLKQIFVVRPGEKEQPTAFPVSVTTGMETQGLIEVQAAGLAVGEMVVCRGNEGIYMPTPVIATPMVTTGATSQPSPIESR
ncbi:MAG: efflux RND transporter periplasmic adaptor subunit [Phycisphaerales bacterium]|nr:efflux RND transporter periplasmic adaptor subunit [Phycisphaerales bacterium]